MRDAERWDEEVIDVGTMDQQYSGIPMQEDLGEEQSDSGDDAHNTKEMDTSFREAQSFLLNEHPLKVSNVSEYIECVLVYRVCLSGARLSNIQL